MVSAVAQDPNFWIDVAYLPGSDGLGRENPPNLEFAEMLYDEVIGQSIIARSEKHESKALE
jgi:hypothetical protein